MLCRPFRFCEITRNTRRSQVDGCRGLCLVPDPREKRGNGWVFLPSESTKAKKRRDSLPVITTSRSVKASFQARSTFRHCSSRGAGRGQMLWREKKDTLVILGSERVEPMKEWGSGDVTVKTLVVFDDEAPACDATDGGGRILRGRGRRRQREDCPLCLSGWRKEKTRLLSVCSQRKRRTKDKGCCSANEPQLFGTNKALMEQRFLLTFYSAFVFALSRVTREKTVRFLLQTWLIILILCVIYPPPSPHNYAGNDSDVAVKSCLVCVFPRTRLLACMYTDVYPTQ